MPQRKIMLSVGGNNYRPPLERSKSAPRLMAIEETYEEDDSEINQSQAFEHRSCCTVDPLYPAMTLGRRKCRRGHSIKRTGNKMIKKPMFVSNTNEDIQNISLQLQRRNNINQIKTADTSEDLNTLLLGKNYDPTSPLANELISYFDLRFKSKMKSLEDLQIEDQYDVQTKSDLKNTFSLDDLTTFCQLENNNKNYMNKKNEFSEDTIDNRSSDTYNPNLNINTQDNGACLDILATSINFVTILDNDNGSLSSGCETASTITQVKTDLEQHHRSNEDNYNETVDLHLSHRQRSVLHVETCETFDSDSEFSDESGYVEYQKHDLNI